MVHCRLCKVECTVVVLKFLSVVVTDRMMLRFVVEEKAHYVLCVRRPCEHQLTGALLYVLLILIDKRMELSTST